MKVDCEKLEARAAEIYCELRFGDQILYMAPECIPKKIPSDQIRALARALCEQLNGEGSDG